MDAVGKKGLFAGWEQFGTLFSGQAKLLGQPIDSITYSDFTVGTGHENLEHQ